MCRQGLISTDQAKQVLRKGEGIRHQLKKQADKRGQSSNHAGVRSADFASIIDVIVTMNLERADQPTRKLGESAVYEALAKSWGIRSGKSTRSNLT